MSNKSSPLEDTNDPSDSNWHRWIRPTPILYQSLWLRSSISRLPFYICGLTDLKSPLSGLSPIDRFFAYRTSLSSRALVSSLKAKPAWKGFPALNRAGHSEGSLLWSWLEPFRSSSFIVGPTSPRQLVQAAFSSWPYRSTGFFRLDYKDSPFPKTCKEDMQLGTDLSNGLVSALNSFIHLEWTYVWYGMLSRYSVV